MPTSFKIGIGAAITFLGLAALFYVMPIVSNAVASDEPVYRETDVRLPDSMKGYILAEVGAAGTLVVGISFMSVGLGETFSSSSEESYGVEMKARPTASHDKKSEAAQA